MVVSAALNGIVGTVLVFWLGIQFLGFSWFEPLAAVVASNVAGFFALLLTLALERRPAIRRVLMGNAFKTWAVLAVLFTSFVIGLDPVLRSPVRMALLFIPMVMSNGFMLPLFGKAQDALIRWEYNRAKQVRSQTVSRNQEFAASEGDVVRIET